LNNIFDKYNVKPREDVKSNIEDLFYEIENKYSFLIDINNKLHKVSEYLIIKPVNTYKNYMLVTENTIGSKKYLNFEYPLNKNDDIKSEVIDALKVLFKGHDVYYNLINNLRKDNIDIYLESRTYTNPSMDYDNLICVKKN